MLDIKLYVRRLPGRIKCALEEREYRPLYHLLAVAVIIAAACFLFYRHFGHPGTLIAADMTWPDSIARLQFKVLNTWSPFGSYPGPAAPIYFFWTYPSGMLARLLHLSASKYMFLMFLGTFSLAGTSMYALTYSIIRKLDLKRIAAYAPYVGAVVAGLVYMYNPWSIHYLRPYFAYPIYALLPLIFLAMVKTFDSPSLRNIILFSIFITVANTTYTLTWLWGLIVPYAIYIVVVSKPRKEALKKSVKALFGSAFLFLLLNAQWIFPYLGAKMSGRPFVAFYGPVMSREMLAGLSANSTMANNFRLLSAWAWSVDKLKGGLLVQAITYAIPVFALLGLVIAYREIRRNRDVNFWAMLAVLTILLATGTTFIVARLYTYFSFDAPGSSLYGWMIRCSERWLFFVAPFFALMIGILVSKLLKNRPPTSGGRTFRGVRDRLLDQNLHTDDDVKPQEGAGEMDRLTAIESSIAVASYRRSTAAGLVVVALVLTSMLPKALDWANNIYNPTQIPKDYQKYERYIAKKAGDPRVVWLPFGDAGLMDYKWAPEKKINPPYGTIISGPNLGSYYELLNNDSYFNWLQGLYLETSFPSVKLENRPITLKKDVLSSLLVPFSARYMILDKSVQGNDFGNNLSSDTSVNLEKTTNYLRIYKTETNPGYIWAATKTIEANSFFDNLAFSEKLPANELANVTFTDGKSYFGYEPSVSAKYGAVALNDYLDLVNENDGFEASGPGGGFAGWSWAPHSKTAKVSADTKLKVAGERSLKISNSSDKQYDIAFVYGNPIPVVPGSIYSIESNVAYKNTKWTHVSLEGYDDKSKSWILLISCPAVQSGNSSWRKYYGSLDVPQGIKAMRVRLGGGWVKDPNEGEAISWFDNVKISRVNDGIYNEIANKPEAPTVVYKKISAEKFKVKITGAKSPFVLIQSETHDPLWVVRMSDGTKINAQPFYKTICGYPISKTGNFELTIEYEPQRWYAYGLTTVLIVLLLCLVYLLYDWKLRRRLTEAYGGGGIDGIAKGGRRLAVKVGQFIKGPPREGQGTRSIQVKRKSTDKRIHADNDKGPLAKIRAFIEEPPRRGQGNRGMQVKHKTEDERGDTDRGRRSWARRPADERARKGRRGRKKGYRSG